MVNNDLPLGKIFICLLFFSSKKARVWSEIRYISVSSDSTSINLSKCYFLILLQMYPIDKWYLYKMCYSVLFVSLICIDYKALF